MRGKNKLESQTEGIEQEGVEKKVIKEGIWEFEIFQEKSSFDQVQVVAVLWESWT